MQPLPRPAPGEPVFLFVHVMKTAGTSLLAAAYRHFGRQAVEPAFDGSGGPIDAAESRYTSLAHLRDLGAERRAEVRLYAGHYPLLVREVVEPDVTMTVLREPVARAVSLLRQVRRNRPELADRTLEQIYDDPWVGSTLVQNYQVKLFAMTSEELDWTARLTAELFGLDVAETGDQPHLVPYEMNDERLERAKANLEQVEEVGLQVQFPEFLDRLERRHRWKVGEAPEVRRAPPSEEPVPEALLQRIRGDLGWDLAFYDFAVDLCERRARTA